MVIFQAYSIEWTNARKAYIACPGEFTTPIYRTPFDGYKAWLQQFGGVDGGSHGPGIKFANDSDATAFKLKFGK